jgi:Ribonuclease HI
MKNTEKRYACRIVCFLSDRQVAIKAIDSFHINSKLVLNCHQFLVKLAENNRIQLVWVPGHMGIDGDERAEELVRQGSLHALI